MGIDWSKAPEWAQAHGRCGHRNFWISEQQYAPVTRPDKTTICTGIFGSASFSNIVKRHQQWPEETRIDRIGRDRTLDDMGHYDDIREQQAQSAAPLTNKYDRTIIGKHGTGKCVVDVYRVLNAFPTGSPEIDHAVKKLLAAGKRGAKDELQDLREAVQSIEARIDYLMELQGEK
jgi:hypothetical protein